MTSLLKEELKDFKLDPDEYISLLTKFISESKYVQNNARQGLIPQESKIVSHIKTVLEPYAGNGNPLVLEELTYIEGRPNFKITYPGTSNDNDEGCIGFIGSHLDVVPANPENWDRDPFSLSIEGNKLYGRGTTDCLGHVAMITLLMKELAKHKPPLKKSVVVLFIAGEEGGENGVGVDMVMKNNQLEELKTAGTCCYWIDSADSLPCVGTAGAIEWHLKTTGKLFHSGLPHRGINSLELAMDAVSYMQSQFYKDFPPHSKEQEYNFATPSTMKPTQMECFKGSLNQIPPWTMVSGDVRLTPFYDILEVMNKLEQYVKEINDNIETIFENRGPCSKYVLKDDSGAVVQKGVVELQWKGSDENNNNNDEDKEKTLQELRLMEGIACHLQSKGLEALCLATSQVKGTVETKPYSITGSLPLVRQMQNEGLDIQITGFGLSSTYHADNEYALLSDMVDAYQILLRVISIHNT